MLLVLTWRRIASKLTRLGELRWITLVAGHKLTIGRMLRLFAAEWAFFQDAPNDPPNSRSSSIEKTSQTLLDK